MPTPTASVKVNPLTGALIDPIAATFASANGFLTGGTSDAKDSVVCATTANGTLATAFENGDTVDGITLATGNRILIKNQSSQAENGIYTVNASGAPTRATDFDSWTEIVGAFVSVESGTVNAGTQWLCNVVSGGTLNTTAITFVVPKNFVDLTTTQTVTGAKTFNNITGSVIESTTIGVTAPAAGWFTLVNGLYISVGSGASLGISGDLGVSFDAPATESIMIRSAASSDVTLPASGTLATTTGNVATATALATARNIFNISFDGTANVDGDATSTGHFASVPGTGAAGHFVTKNGTAPTLIAGRSAWYSDGSGVPSFKNGTGTAVTLVRSSDIGVSVQAYDADLTTWAGITPGANVGTFLATPSGANLASALTSALPVGAGGTGVSTSGTTSQIAVGGGTGSAIVWTTATGTGAPVRADSPSFTTQIVSPIFKGTSSDVVMHDGAGNVCFRGIRATTWTDSATGQYFQVGSQSGNTIFTTANAFSAGRMAFFSGSAQFSNGTRASCPVPTDVLEIISNANAKIFGFTNAGSFVLTKTITAGGTTGAQTIDKASGSVNFAAAATSLVVTNSLCTTSSVIHCTIATNDATAANVKAVAAAGSFTIYLTTAPTAETRVNFLLTN